MIRSHLNQNRVYPRTFALILQKVADVFFFEQKIQCWIKMLTGKKISESKNEMLGIVGNAFSQSLKPNGPILGG